MVDRWASGRPLAARLAAGRKTPPLDHPGERAAGDAENARGLLPAAAGGFENSHHMTPLHFFQREEPAGARLEDRRAVVGGGARLQVGFAARPNLDRELLGPDHGLFR